jgi:hypothetical protein
LANWILYFRGSYSGGSITVFHFNNPQVRIKFFPAGQERCDISFSCRKRQLLNESPVAIPVKGRARSWTKEMKAPVKPVDDNKDGACFGGTPRGNRAILSFNVAAAHEGLNPDFGF